MDRVSFAFTINPIDDDVIDSIMVYMEQFEKARLRRKECLLSEYGEHGTLTQYREYDPDSQEINKMITVNVDRSPEVELDGQEPLGSGSDVFRNAAKIVGIGNHHINNLMIRNDSGDPDAFDELSDIVYRAVQILIDREGVSHVDDVSNVSMPGPMHSDTYAQRMGRKKTFAEPFGDVMRENKMLMTEADVKRIITEEATKLLNETWDVPSCGCKAPDCPECAAGEDMACPACGEGITAGAHSGTFWPSNPSSVLKFLRSCMLSSLCAI